MKGYGVEDTDEDEMLLDGFGSRNLRSCLADNHGLSHRPPEANNMSSPTRQALHAQALGTSFLAVIAEMDRIDRERLESVTREKGVAKSNSRHVLHLVDSQKKELELSGL